MNYYGSKELAASFRTVRNNTVKIAEDIPENQYEFRAAPDTRTVAQSLTHIALSTRFQQRLQTSKVSDLSTLNFPDLFKDMVAEEAKPRTKSEIIALLKSEGDSYASFLEGLSEPFLAETVKMSPQGGGGTKTRFEMLLGPKEHEMHHRAQLMTIQRMIGQVPHLTRLMQDRMAQAQANAGQQAQR
jgi:uncharacterized damage-inducible protein DinB